MIALAAARTAATAVANVLAAARARAAAEAAPAVTVPGRCHKLDLCNNVHNHRGRCNQKRKPNGRWSRKSLKRVWGYARGSG